MTYTILVGSLNEADCHTEFDVDTVDDAIAHLWAFAHCANPEPAIANIGDFKTFVGNDGWHNQKIPANIAATVRKYIDEENESIRECRHIPDMTIIPTSEGCVQITSIAMQCELHASLENLTDIIKSLTSEYRDLIDAGEISTPTY